MAEGVGISKAIFGDRSDFRDFCSDGRVCFRSDDLLVTGAEDDFVWREKLL